jgi:hypothetical protein
MLLGHGSFKHKISRCNQRDTCDEVACHWRVSSAPVGIQEQKRKRQLNGMRLAFSLWYTPGQSARFIPVILLHYVVLAVCNFAIYMKTCDYSDTLGQDYVDLHSVCKHWICHTTTTLLYYFQHCSVRVSFICSQMSVKFGCSRDGRTQTEGFRAEGNIWTFGGGGGGTYTKLEKNCIMRNFTVSNFY